MTHYIYDDTGLPTPKFNLGPLPPGANPNQWLNATEWTLSMQAMLDIKSWARGALWYGIIPAVSQPAHPGVADILWLRNDEVLMHNAIELTAPKDAISTLPEQWSRLALTDSLDEPLSAQVSQNYDTVQVPRAGSIVGLSVRLTDPWDAGTVTVTVTVNGNPVGLQAVLPFGDEELTVTQNSNIDTFLPDDVIGLQLETSGDWSSVNTVNLEAWIDVAHPGIPGLGGGGGGSWLTVDPVEKTANFIPAPGMLYLLGNPGKAGNVNLPLASSIPPEQAVALKLVNPTQAWSVNPNGSDTIDFSTIDYEFTVGVDGMAWIILVSDGNSNWSTMSSNRTLRVLNNSVAADPDDRLTGQIDFYSPIKVDGSIGEGRIQVFLDPDYVWPHTIVPLVGPGGSISLTYPGINVITASSPTTCNILVAASVGQRKLIIKNKYTSTSTITIDALGADTIDGALTYPLAVGESIMIAADGGSNWEVISAI